MKEGSPVFVDTNVLIYAAVEDSPFHPFACRAMEVLFSSSAPVWISRQVLREYIAVMSRPKLDAPAVPITTMVRQVLHFQSRFRIAEDGPAVTEFLLSLFQEIPVAGKQIHDANIVATALAYGIPCILTNNVSDFERFSERIEIVPLGAYAR
jgi:predicted nucleic acid-binding protein